MKRIGGLIALVVILGGLAAAYFFLGQKDATVEEATAEPSKTVSLVKKSIWEVTKASFHSDNGEMEIYPVLTPNPTPAPTAAPDPEATPSPVPEETPTPTPTPTPIVGWAVKGFENAKLTSYTVTDIMRSVYALDASEQFMPTVSNPADFKLDPPQAYAEVEYSDGEKKKIMIGAQTPDKSSYYMMIEGDPALYLTYSSTGEDFFKTPKDLLDKTITMVASDALEYVYIAPKGKSPIEFAYKGTEEEKQSDIQTYGGIGLYMVQPYDGWDLYASNFQTNVLDGMSGIAMDSVIDANPSNLADYGLDDPALEVWLTDSSTDLHFLIGNDIDDETAYAMFYGTPYVYSMQKSYVAGLYDINVFKFTQRFIALVNIDNCAGIDITGPGRSHSMTIVHQTISPTPIPTPTTDPAATPSPVPAESPAPTATPIPQKVIHPTVDGTVTQEGAFKDFYQTVIGLGYDSEIQGFTPSGAPEITIKYTMIPGLDPIDINLYTYNQNFYAIEKDGGDIRFVINKQYLDLMFQTLDDMKSGKFDE
ncbi:MAG: DUF4340 domain-containing protein [Clostridiales bacterium]|nr:DUF4340 domain-containing protein [Clostridiales bacterium]